MSETKGMNNRILRIALLPFLAVFLILAFSGAITAQAAQISPDANTWSALQDAIDGAESGDTITLSSDVIATESDIALSVPDGMVLTLDLNGHTVDRHLTESGGVDGAVISIQSGAVLTVKDSSKSAGKITGGYASHGGGFRNIGTLIVEGGCITGNCATDGGGGIVNYGVLVVKGGTVTGNTAGVEGGGIYNSAKSYLTVDKAAVYGNNAPKGTDICNAGSMKTIGAIRLILSPLTQLLLCSRFCLLWLC